MSCTKTLVPELPVASGHHSTEPCPSPAQAEAAVGAGGVGCPGAGDAQAGGLWRELLSPRFVGGRAKAGHLYLRPPTRTGAEHRHGPVTPETILLPPQARSCSYTAVLAGLPEHVELSALSLCQEVISCCESFAERDHDWDFNLLCFAMELAGLGPLP